MAVPVIDSTSSILGCYQHEYFEYQPFATNTPTGWLMGSAPLPFGASLDATTGLVTFDVVFPGVYNFSLIAVNGDGDSAEQLFTVGVEESTMELSSAIEASIDLASRSVSLAALNIKRGDDVNFLITFTKGGVVVDLDLENLIFNVSANLAAYGIAIGAQQWLKSGVLSSAVFRLHVIFTSPQLDSYFFNEQNPQTALAGFGEFEWVENVVSPMDGWPSTLRGSSANFPVNVTVDLSTDAIT